MKTIVVELALAMALAVSAQALAVDPRTLSSFKPFKTFQEGEGEGYARAYVPRSKEQFTALLATPGRWAKETRVDCSVFLRQIMEAHPSLPRFEGCAGAARVIQQDPDFTVGSCQKGMFERGGSLLGVASPAGSEFGAWYRKCIPGETVLFYKGVPIASTMCINPAIPSKAPPSKPAVEVSKPVPDRVATPTPACPNGIHLVANAWELDSVPADRQEALLEEIRSATLRESEDATNPEAYKTDAFSRTWGPYLMSEINVRAPVGITIRAYVLDPSTLKVLRDLGDFRLVDGIVKIPLTEAEREMIVKTVWPAYFSSPVISAEQRQLWFFPYEWVRKDGKNGGRWCTMHEHGGYWKKNKPS